MEWVKWIQQWIPVLAGVATVAGLFFIWRQLGQSERHSKITRSNQLIDLYYTHYANIADEHMINEIVSNHKFDIDDSKFITPFYRGGNPYLPAKLRDALENSVKKSRYISFYIILGVYWYHDLIDKPIIKKLIPIESDYVKYEKERKDIIEKNGLKNIFIYWDKMIEDIKTPVALYNINDHLKTLRS